jgi:hypothetical protein
VDGRRSKYLPNRLLGQYRALLADPELVAVRDDVALIDSRSNDLLRRVDLGESGQLWRRLRATHVAFMAAQRVGDVDAAADALAELGGLIDAGADDVEVWADIVDAIEIRRRLVDTEARRQRDLDGMITVDLAMSLVAAVGEIVNAKVTDQDVRREIARDVYALIDHGDDDPPPQYRTE